MFPWSYDLPALFPDMSLLALIATVAGLLPKLADAAPLPEANAEVAALVVLRGV